MILREPRLTREDCRFIAECYVDWPESKGPVYEQEVKLWIKRYRTRDGEKGLVGEVGGLPVGFLLYASSFYVAVIYELVVHPDLRSMGHGRSMWRELKDKLTSEGVVVAEFEAIPGIVADKTTNGPFLKVSEGVGEHTGLPTVKGRVTADMKV